MVQLRQEKVNRVANYIPEQTVMGEPEGDVLIVSWGGTQGSVQTAVAEMQKEGKKVSSAHFNYIMPLPKNTAEYILKIQKDNCLRIKQRTVCLLPENDVTTIPVSAIQ